MNKSTTSVYVARMIMLSSFIISVGYLFLPLLSVASEQKFYRNCAELQKHLNDNNSELTIKGFEKIKMIRRDLTGYANHAAGDYTLFCNGGIVIDRGEGTICRGYIGYSYKPHVSGANYYASWGRTNGLKNDNDTGQEKYCRRIK